MSTCKVCIHSSVCTPYNAPNDESLNIGDCPHFKHIVDFPEVVRCRECKFMHNKWLGCSKLKGLVPFPNFYCAYGERKESEVRE